VPSPPPHIRLRLESLTTHQLSAVSLGIPAGGCITLAAPSGTGKTRLLRAIADLDEHQGDVYVDDRACGEFQAPTWRRMVALLTTESQWWYDTVGAHFPRVELEWLRALGFERDVLDRQVAFLSSGERQRLALLRLLGNRPKVLLLDEPTASLDPENAGRIEGLVAAYRRDSGAAVIWISHDGEQARRVARRHFTIAGGQVVERTQ
jgi:ABC-type iron transport system FetAB ATPase subunit